MKFHAKFYNWVNVIMVLLICTLMTMGMVYWGIVHSIFFLTFNMVIWMKAISKILCDKEICEILTGKEVVDKSYEKLNQQLIKQRDEMMKIHPNRKKEDLQ